MIIISAWAWFNIGLVIMRIDYKNILIWNENTAELVNSFPFFLGYSLTVKGFSKSSNHNLLFSEKMKDYIFGAIV